MPEKCGGFVNFVFCPDLSVHSFAQALEREIEIWSRLHHDHIVPFYGACTMTSRPFIVLRYMQNGNLVQYLASMPNADRTKLVSICDSWKVLLITNLNAKIFEVSLGMYYLHEEHIVHGDLKGVRANFSRVFIAHRHGSLGKYFGRRFWESMHH